MPNKIQLHLPRPCHEDWNIMSPADQGRFCNSCQKEVVDFTGMSDSQLVAFLKKPSIGSVCGRFNNDQLERDLAIPGKRMPWLKYFLQLLVPTFLFASKAKAQGEPRFIVDTISVETKKVLKDKDGNPVEEKVDLKKIRGKVLDENGMGIAHASVVIKGTRRGVMTDIDGNYEIDMSGFDPKQIIVFSSVGFMTVERSIGSLQIKAYCILQLTPMIMGELIVTGPGKRKKVKKSN